MNQSRDTLVLEIHALTPRLVMLTFVRRLVVSTFVMMLVVNLSWTNLVGCFFVQYLGTALRGGCVLMMNGMLMEQQQGGVADEPEPFMGSGRFARAIMLGYNCSDEKELEHALRFC